VEQLSGTRNPLNFVLLTTADSISEARNKPTTIRLDDDVDADDSLLSKYSYGLRSILCFSQPSSMSDNLDF